MAILNVPITTDFSAQNLLNIDTINMSGAGLCCTNPVRDSSCESSVIAWVDEQAGHPGLQDPELARV